MKFIYTYLLIFVSLISCAQENQTTKLNHMSSKFNTLTPFESYVINDKGTERPFTGEYDDFYEKGVYVCKKCDAPLYNSSDKFDGHCGWPAFDDEIDDAVTKVADADGRRVEIVCSNCQGHLGHVFVGEQFTEKNTRHCVNSISLKFIPNSALEQNKVADTLKTAYFASGCFWGTEYYFSKYNGVKETTVGYIGGSVKNPTYRQVCTGRTGHAEAVKVIYNPSEVTYESLAKLFFETHNQSQLNRQGPDVGEQYRSEVFYVTGEEKKIVNSLIDQLLDNGYEVVTKVTKATEFYPAETYHQQYYDKKGGSPYCHFYKKKFND
jgi:peptide methionine sulfoxide reductase msrA/msrB